MNNKGIKVKKTGKKKWVVLGILFVMIATLVVLGITGKLPYFIAKTTSDIYISQNYPDKNLVYQEGSYEYMGVYDEYGLIYKNNKGEECGLRMSPSFFPASVSYDSLNHGV